MDSRNDMKLVIPSLSVNEGFARVAVGAFAARLNPTLEQLADIKTVVSEAVTNAIIHGYENGLGDIEITASVEGRKLILIIADHGIGIEDIALARQPFFTSRPDDERSGMGFTVMETFMDEIQVESQPGKGTLVRMEKIIPLPREEAHKIR